MQCQTNCCFVKDTLCIPEICTRCHFGVFPMADWVIADVRGSLFLSKIIVMFDGWMGMCVHVSHHYSSKRRNCIDLYFQRRGFF